jgi:hypothetical protein
MSISRGAAGGKWSDLFDLLRGLTELPPADNMATCLTQ